VVGEASGGVSEREYVQLGVYAVNMGNDHMTIQYKANIVGTSVHSNDAVELTYP